MAAGDFDIPGMPREPFVYVDYARDVAAQTLGVPVPTVRFDAAQYAAAASRYGGTVEANLRSLANGASPAAGTSVVAEFSGSGARGYSGEFRLREPRRERQVRRAVSGLPDRAESNARNALEAIIATAVASQRRQGRFGGRFVDAAQRAAADRARDAGVRSRGGGRARGSRAR